MFCESAQFLKTEARANIMRAHIWRPERARRFFELTFPGVLCDGMQNYSTFENTTTRKHYAGAGLASVEVQTSGSGEAKRAEISACVTYREIDAGTHKSLRASFLAARDGSGSGSGAETRRQETRRPHTRNVWRCVTPCKKHDHKTAMDFTAHT